MTYATKIIWRTAGPAPAFGCGSSYDVLANVLRDNAALHDLFAAARSRRVPILLVVNDAYRQTRTRETLAALAECTARLRGIPAFHVLVATGAHVVSPQARRAFEKETFHACGLSVAGITWHDALAQTELADVGCGRFNVRLARAELVLAIGSVEPHYFAGITGAHKTLTIGCMGRDDIERNHAEALSPQSQPLRLEGNPVFDGIARALAALQSGRTIAAVDQVVRQGEVIDAAVGDPIRTARTLLPLVRRTYVYELAEPVDLLHLKVPLPLGCSWYQADKAVKNSERAVRAGGGIVLEAACAEGVGPDTFMSLLHRGTSHAGVMRIVRDEGYRLGDHKAVRLRQLTGVDGRNVRFALVSSSLSAAAVNGAGFGLFGDVDSAVAWLARSVGGRLEHGLVVEDAGNVCVSVRPHDD